MAVDYQMNIYRKCDGKKLATTYINEIKSIRDSGLSHEFIYTFDSCNKSRRFSVDELESYSTKWWNKYLEVKAEIDNIKSNIYKCKNLDVKHEFEDDIQYKTEELEYIMYSINAVNQLIGKVNCLVVDNIKGKSVAYEYNGKDLPKETRKYGNGDEYQESVMIWCNKVELEIEAIY